MSEMEKFRKAYRSMPLGFERDWAQVEPQRLAPTDTWGETLSINVGFETDPEVLKPFLPEGVTLAKNEVWFFQNTYRNVSFLAGNGYDFFGVRIFTRYEEKDMDAVYYLVCWMNDGYAVMTGREGSGFPKLLADVMEPTRTKTGYRSYLHNYGHKMIEMEIKNMERVTGPEFEAYRDEQAKSWRTFLYKYMPSRTKFGVADTNCLTTCYARTYVDELYYGEGSFELFDTTWTQSPPSWHVIQGLQKFPVNKMLKAFVYKGSIVGETQSEILWDKSGESVL